MNREDEICLTLQGLINGIDYETGEIVEFSDTVKNSLKVISATFECRERCQQISNISESKQSKVDDWDMVSGTFKEIIQTIKSDRPNYLVIIQNGYFYEALGEDATFFVDRFSYNTFDWKGVIKTGFPIHSEKIFSDLREMKQPFVLVSQLPKGEGQKVRRAISDVYDGDNTTIVSGNNHLNDTDSNSITEDKCEICGRNIPKGLSACEYYCKGEHKQATGVQIENDSLPDVDNPCSDCGCEIPQARLDNVAGSVRCTQCQSEFEIANPGSVSRKIKEEGILTREGAKRMRAKQYGTNIHNKI